MPLNNKETNRHYKQRVVVGFNRQKMCYLHVDLQVDCSFDARGFEF